MKWRTLPLIVFLYFLAYLDRTNVGFAKLEMSHAIGLSEAAYGLGAGIFFIGYAIFEIPSNAGMMRFGARKWIARILVTWGFCAAIMAAVQNEATFYIVRFLLGAAEAGFFPAVILYLTLWFPARQRVTVLGIFVLALPISSAIGAPVSALLLNMDGFLGLAGWQWLYIFQGVPAMLMAVVALKMLTDYPRDAKWLTVEERTWLQNTMDAEDAAKSEGSEHKHSFMAGLKDPRALVFSALYFGLAAGLYGLALWLPTIVKAMGHLSTTAVGFIVPIPYVCAAFFVYFWSRNSDRTGERVLHTAGALLLSAIGMAASAFLLATSPVLALVGLCVAAMGVFAAMCPFWELPATALAGAAAASGIALINSLGNLGGFVAPYAVGILSDVTGDSKAGLLLLAALLFLSGVGTFFYGRKIHAGQVPAGTDEDLSEGDGRLRPAG
ncbi:MFS transporter [Tsukamurella soli]|uniref:MFS transporter n=1 Tax=Tsukamurella soli TaxID=644556 RepID=UPI0031EF08A7